MAADAPLMNAELSVREAIRETLEADGALRARVNQISDGEPVKASGPWLMLGEGSGTGFGARGVSGVALRVPVILTLRGDTPEDTSAILAALDTAMQAVPDEVNGWKITVLRFERSRLRRDKTGWRIVTDYALRLVRLN